MLTKPTFKMSTYNLKSTTVFCINLVILVRKTKLKILSSRKASAAGRYDLLPLYNKIGATILNTTSLNINFHIIGILEC